MLGTGTQLDPYQITTVAEFRGMNDATAYFKLMNDLDVNDSEWATNWTGVTLAFKEFDGNGHMIRNINADLAENGIFQLSTTSSEVKNLLITNVILRGTNATLFSQSLYSLLKLTNVQIYMDFNLANSSGGVLNNTNLSLDVNKCSFNLKGVTTGYCLIAAYVTAGQTQTQVRNSIFIIDCALARSVGELLGGLSVKVCILGKLKLTAASGTTNIFWRTPQQCYTALEITTSGALAKFSDTNPTSTCFYDQELAGITMTAQTNVHPLSTSQCKDKDYLNSIGFVVI